MKKQVVINNYISHLFDNLKMGNGKCGSKGQRNWYAWFDSTIATEPVQFEYVFETGKIWINTDWRSKYYIVIIQKTFNITSHEKAEGYLRRWCQFQIKQYKNNSIK